MIKLVVQSGLRRGQVFFLPPGMPVEIGRSEDCFVRLEEAKVSRRHAILSPAGICHRIKDLDSINGTFVNDRRIRECLLKSGDRIRVGDTELAYLLVEKDPWIGRVLAGYHILDSLGKGGMGQVYLAQQPSLDRLVALKILAPELSQDSEFVARLVEEARAMAKVSHPHVVQVHSVGCEEGTCFLSMEYLEGGSLRLLLDAEGPLPPRRAVAIALDAADALVWAETQGIVHRDIKPGNILLDANGNAKVGDFGLAADLTRAEFAREEGHVRGSPHFMAPEQAQGKLPDHRCDIYALGTTLYVALSGKAPFSGRTLREVLAEKLRADPPPISRLRPGIPPRLDAIIGKAMARQPEDRYQHAADLVKDLEQVAKSLEKTTAPAAPSDREHLRSRRNSPPVWVFGAAGAALGMAILAAVYWLPGFPSGGIRRLEPEPATPKEGAPAAAERQPPAERTDALLPEPSSQPPAETRASPSRLDELENLLRELDLLLLESRFAEAQARLENFRRSHPEVATRIEAEAARARAAELLFRARGDALALERQGDLEGAAGLLRQILDALPEPYRNEALQALQAIEARSKSHSPPGR